MKCPECDAENLDDAAFCTLCGHAFDESEREGNNSVGPVDWKGASPSDIFYRKISFSREPEVIEHRPIGKIIRTTVITLIIAGLFITGFVLLIPRVLPEEVVYSSSISALTFEYPSKWSQVQLFEVENVGGLEQGDFDYFNEVILTDKIDRKNSYLLMSTSIKGVSDKAFESKRRDSKQLLMERFYAQMDPKAKPPTITFTDTHINGDPAFIGTFEYTSERRKALMNVAVIHNGNTTYYLYLTRYGTDDSDVVFDEITESIKFKD